MITDSYSTMISDAGLRSVLQSNGYSGELGLDRNLSMYRSGSAPPTVEGSLSAAGGLFSGGSANFGNLTEEELRSDPAYILYYYSNVNLNPRLPPPLPSKEDWRFAQRLQGSDVGPTALGGIGDRRKATGEGGSWFNGKSEQNGRQWSGDGLIGLPGLVLGSRQKSIGEVIQDDITHSTSVVSHPSRPASRNAFENGVDESESHFVRLRNDVALMNPSVQKTGLPGSHTYASALGASLSRSTTPDPQLDSRAPSPRIPPVGEGRPNSICKRNMTWSEPADLAAALSSMTLSTNEAAEEEKRARSLLPNIINDTQNLFQPPADENHMKQQPFSSRSESGQFHVHSASNSYLKGPSTPVLSSSRGNSSSLYLKVDSPNSSFSSYGYSGYAAGPTSPSLMGNQAANLPPLFENLIASSSLGVSPMESRALEMPLVDPLYFQYPRTSDPMIDNKTNQYMDLLGPRNAYLGPVPSPQKSQYGLSYLNKSATMNNDYFSNSTLGSLDMSYSGSPLAGLLLPSSPFGTGSPVRYGERSMCLPFGLRNFGGGVMGSWHLGPGGNLDGRFASSLLEEFKSNKKRCFELSEISGHVVEFSADQYGSRFIQQKLETATLEDKNMVFHEINPQALALMTDVFGNYVIQKFFEHGTPAQIRELANQLDGHVLTLSLQMYGCRVIQKAIEVVDLDQQTKMVAELDGHVMRCVRDQNGNHVIQKCIECVPEGAIQFIISVFYDQVVTLSTHPYGCRVVQRVLEHCADPKTQQIVMNEIMQSVCLLAQDQYGNYVVQHLLEHGQPHERSAIINKLVGQIVRMSQQKFASNVVEKCLSFGTPAERQILVDEMLGSDDGNDPLQVMMKDQFANYVVQKVLETCDDQQLELILSRIKVHLNALKKYTYGKHIVARVEKLVAAGEKRISILASYSALVA